MIVGEAADVSTWKEDKSHIELVVTDHTNYVSSGW